MAAAGEADEGYAIGAAARGESGSAGEGEGFVDIGEFLVEAHVSEFGEVGVACGGLGPAAVEAPDVDVVVGEVRSHARCG